MEQSQTGSLIVLRIPLVSITGRKQNYWVKTKPPTGDGWQLWETFSQGSPVSPVFSDRYELQGWVMGYFNIGWEQADRFLSARYAPTAIITHEVKPGANTYASDDSPDQDDPRCRKRGKETTTFWHVAYDDEEDNTRLIGVEMDTLTGIMNELDSIRDHDDRWGMSHDNPDHYYLVTQERTPWSTRRPETAV